MQNVAQPWVISSDEVLKSLESSQLEGLSDKEVNTRLLRYGKNVFENKEKKNPFFMFLKQFVSPLIFLLIGAAVVTGLLKEWVDMSVILFAVFLNVGLGFYHEYSAENTLDKLTTYIKDRTKVIREGREEEVDSSSLVPGDIIKLSYGSRIPADARIISSNNLRVDEAVLTGESISVEKHDTRVGIATEVADRKNVVHGGTLVVEGFALAVVYATGNDTEIGKIAKIVGKVERSKTPLQKGVDKFAWFVFVVVIIIVVVLFVVGVLKGESFLPMLVLSSAVAVGAVPESLPITLTVILAIGATRIANKKGVIRKLSAAETLGSTTLIMTDKTGTLTEAKMKLVGIFSRQDILMNKNTSSSGAHFSAEQKKLLELSLFNVDVSVENPKDPEHEWDFLGRTFEVNIARAALHHGISAKGLLERTKSLILPFNSTNKFSVSTTGDDYVIMGAPDILLKRSKIDKENYLKISKWMKEVSFSGKRLIGLARFKKSEGKEVLAEDVKDIEFLGAFAFFDPIRSDVPDAIRKIKSYGIKMVLITGDLVGTARSVAKDLGWDVSDSEVIEGADLHKMPDEELLKILPSIKIFARVTPEDKLRVGSLYQKLGEVVAMTGDGVNDAPALKAVDIGISLGSGSDVAKSAADIVLLDDNFKTISLAVEEGRKILTNTRKAFVYLMSTSFNEVFVIGGALLAGIAFPLNALQIIWVNLFTESLPAIAFAFDEDLDKEKNKGKDLGLIFTPEVKTLAFGIGIVSSVLLFVIYYLLINSGLETKIAQSIFFVSFSSYVLVVAYSFRSLHKPIFSYNIFSNKKLNYSLLISFGLFLLTVGTPFMRKIFSLETFPAKWWLFVVAWIIFNVALIEVAKFILSHLHRKISQKKA